MKKFSFLLVICIVLLSSILICSFVSCKDDSTTLHDLNFDSKMSFANDYEELSPSRTNSVTKWREGMVSGNGLQGFITSGSPYSDTLIYQNIHFILPNKNVRENPISFDDLDTVRQQIVKGQDIVDNQSYDDMYMYHAGGTLRIQQQENESIGDYIRYTDYDTAQVGVRYTDSQGTWERLSFTSQADGVSITKISSSTQNTKLNLTLSLDNISAIANYGNGNEVDLQYKKLVGEDLDYLAFVAHYPDYDTSELQNGAYATMCYVICEGGSKEKVLLDPVKDAQYKGEENPAIGIKNADNVYIITISDRTYDMGTMDSFEGMTSYDLVDELYNKCAQTASKYSSDGKFSYANALKAHTDIFTPLFNSVEFDINGDNSLDNRTLLNDQRNNKNTLQNSLAQKAYYSGRYAYLCCAGYSTSRLYGMWTGEWDCGWGSKYTMDANVNLQTSSMNTGNIISAPLGYVNFILRQVPDWEDNAYATHGMTDAIQAPVNTDGDRALFTESCYPYPFRYWNAGSSWMLQPLYETLLCYGDLQVPITDEFDIDALKSVLSTTATDLTQSQIDAYKERGYLNLKEDIMLPLLIKSVNYWRQLLTPEYYTDAQGYIHYEEGKTQLEEGETYCIIPSYSPENNPSNYSSPACANSAIDISACNNNIDMLISVMTDLDPDADVSELEKLKANLPKLLFDDTGAIKEWATYQFEENNTHRHLSHLYCVWPLNDAQYDEALKNAAIQAIENRASENEASHALVHRSLIATRLKDRDALTEALLGLMSQRIHYDSLMTNHDTDRGSCYCTDFAIGYVGIVNESLVYSDQSAIELLPCLPTSGFESGSVSGIRLKTQAVLTSMNWNLSQKTVTATITPEKDCSVTISCPLSSQSQKVDFKKGQSVTIEFSLDKI